MKKKDPGKATAPKKVASQEEKTLGDNNPPVSDNNVLEGVIDLNDIDNGQGTTPSLGLGDTIKKITDLLGFKTCDTCEKRRIAFNKKYRYLNPKRDLTDEEVEVLNKVTKAKRAMGNEANILYDAYNEVFAVKLDRCNCTGQFKSVLDALNLWNDETNNRKPS